MVDIRALIKNNYFAKTLFLFIATLIICVISVAGILFHRLKMPLQTSLEMTQKKHLDQMATMSDAYVLRQIDNIIISNIYQAENEFAYFFALDEAQSANSNALLHVYEKLSDLANQFDIFHSLIIYNAHAGILISSDQGVTLIRNQYNHISKMPFDLEAVHAVMYSSKQSDWVSNLYHENSLNETNILSYICTVPIIPTTENVQGCVIFNLPTSTLVDYFNDTSNTNDENFLIMDNTGRFIVSSNSISKKYTDYIQASPLIFQAADGITSYDGNSIVWRKSQVNDWIYIKVFPLSSIFSEIKLASQYTTMLVITFIFIFGLLIYVITKWLHKPILKLIDRVNANGENEHDVFMAVEHTIINLSSRVGDLESMLEQNKGFIENQIITDILYHNISSADEVKARFSTIDMNFDYPYFTLIFAQFSSTLLKKLDFKQRAFLFLQTAKQLETHYNRFGRCISIQHKDCILLVLGHDTITVFDNLTQLNINISNSINIGLCDTVTDILALYKSFDMLPVYQKYSFIYGYGNVFTQSEIIGYENSHMDIYHDFCLDADIMLKSGRIDELKENIQEAIAFIRNNGCSYDYAQNFLIQLVNTIGRISRDENLINDQFLKSTLISEFNAAETLAEFENWIISLLDVYLQEFSQKNANIQSLFIQNVVEYITNNITENLSLKTVATKFGISDGHLSRTFKEAYNINFSVFLNTKKFEAAAEMLITNKSISVTEIAEKLNYYNMPYFNRQFKAKYGVSPLQYRKMHSQ